MKKQLINLMLAATLFALANPLASCTKKDSKTATPTPSSPTLAKGKSSVTATITGTYTGTFKSNEVMSSVAQSSSIINIASATSSALGGSGGLSEQFMIILPANIAVGTYNTRNLTGSSFTYVGSNGISASGWTSGGFETNIVFKVTKSTAEEIEGTFEGTMGEEEKNTTISAKGTFTAKF
ncbi:MAG: hypothetical protein WC716_05285 [Chitinophagaceae bacterium]|jgi:hypothetical protein